MSAVTEAKNCWDTSAWKSLQQHVEEIEQTHLRYLLNVFLDFSNFFVDFSHRAPGFGSLLRYDCRAQRHCYGF